ncbi:MAG TPA: glycoside hydrolase domain-containing protein [Kofleriaceae bacterium]|nr:glycoside hydrolase domain-containing protein [Kofleriaceae bacterium]
MNKISRIKDWKRNSLVKMAAKLALAVGVAGFAVRGDTTAYAQVSVQTRSFDVVAMRLLTESTGWVADDSHVLWTRSYGQQWTDITPTDLGTHRIQTVFFRTELEGWLLAAPDVGGQLDIWRTQDGGASWTRGAVATLSDGGSVSSMEFADADDGWVMVRLPSSANFSLGLLLATADGGQSWKALPSPPIGGELHFTSPTTGSLTGGPTGDQRYVTRDGGQSWEQQVAVPAATDLRPSNLSSQQAVVGMDFQTADRGWLTVASGQCIAGKSQCSQQRKLFTTTDGGRTMHDITPLVATPPGASTNRIFLSVGKGFDKCAIGSVSQMQAWWTNTPWSWANIYIGGANRGCSQAGLNSSWVHSIFTQGWRLVPTWVGLQAPGSSCTGCSKMSTNATTARQQGINEANAAADAASALGLPAPTIIYFDMERYDPTSHPAVKAFINAWVERLRQRGHQAGVYGAGVNATNDWAPIANPPQAVWIANWNNVDGVFNLSGLSNSLWSTHQRIHQFQGPHNETWGGVTFNIDSDRADGPVADD